LENDVAEVEYPRLTAADRPLHRVNEDDERAIQPQLAAEERPVGREEDVAQIRDIVHARVLEHDVAVVEGKAVGERVQVHDDRREHDEYGCKALQRARIDFHDALSG
jgi:hypothetical protein